MDKPDRGSRSLVSSSATSSVEGTPDSAQGIAPIADAPILDNRATPLSLKEVLESVESRYPVLLIAREQRALAAAKSLAALGKLDTKLEGGADWQPLGFFTNTVAKVGVKQPTTFFGSTLFGGWKIGDGSFNPTFDGDRLTNENGEFSGGFSVPLLRNNAIDPIRRDLLQARLGERAASAAVDLQALAIRRNAEISYWRWVEAGELLRIARQLLDLAEARREGIRGRVSSGDLAEIEEVDNNRLVAQRRTKLISARRSVEKSALALALYFRDDDGRPVRVGMQRLPRLDELDTAAQEEMTAPESEALSLPFVSLGEGIAADVQRAWRLRPEFVTLARKRDQLLIEREFREVQALPRVDVSLLASQDLDGRRPTVTKGEFELVASLDVEIPIQNRSARGKLREVEAKLRQITGELRFRHEQVENQVRDARSQLQAARQQRREATRAAELSEQLAAGEQRRFDLGDSDILRLNLREQSLAEARSRAVKAQAGYRVAGAIYRAVVGEPGSATE